MRRENSRACRTAISLLTAVGVTASLAVVGVAASARGSDAVSAVAAIGAAGTDTPREAARRTAPRRHCKVSAKLVPSCGLWWGVSPGTYHDRRAGVLAFEKQLGARVDVYKAYHFAGELFPNRTERRLARQKHHHRLLDIDYVPDGRYSWAQIAAGAGDAQLVREAVYLRRHFTKKLFVSIHHEPEDEVRQTPGSGHTAQDFAAMFRHVVDVFRAHGVKNVVWVFNIMGVQAPDSQPWFPALYPGGRYVDWIAADPYGCYNAKVCHDFDRSTLNQRFSPNAPWQGFYRWAKKAHPSKPLMLSEWAAYTNVGETARVAYLKTVRKQLKKFPRLKAIVYWNSRDVRRGDCALAPGTKSSKVVSNLARTAFFSQKAP